MLQINNEVILNLVKESYSKKYNRLFTKFQKNHASMNTKFREVAENISISIDEIEKIANMKAKELESMPLAYYDLNEEINEVTERLITKVKDSLSDYMKKYNRSQISEKINNIVYQSKEYKTTDKDTERFNRMEIVLSELHDTLTDANIFISIHTDTTKKGKDNKPRTYGILRFKQHLIIFSMNSMDVILEGKNSRKKSRAEGTYVLSEIVQGESIVKGWNKMLNELEKTLDLKTAKEKSAFAQLKQAVKTTIDLRTKVA